MAQDGKSFPRRSMGGHGVSRSSKNVLVMFLWIPERECRVKQTHGEFIPFLRSASKPQNRVALERRLASGYIGKKG
jgi:hypothetical protein